MDCLLVALICSLGMLGVLMAIDAARCVRRRWRCHRPPTTRGYLRLMDEEGNPILSARLPVGGLQQLLEDHRRGRLG